MLNIIRTLIMAGTLLSNVAFAEYVVIVNPANNTTVSKADIENIYLAKTKAFSDGTLAIPLDQEDGTPIRSAFESEIVGKTEAQMKSYWAKLVFTGKAAPIKQMANDQEVMELVAKNPSTIGYVNAESADDTVKIIERF